MRALQAFAVPGVADFKTRNGGNDVVIAGRTQDLFRGLILDDEGQHVPSRQAVQRRLNVAGSLLGLGYRGHSQVPEFSVACRCRQAFGVRLREWLKAHAPALQGTGRGRQLKALMVNHCLGQTDDGCCCV